MDNNTILTLSNISKSFGGVKALSNVSIDVRKGEVHAVVGENGAGKSTLMKVISGALHPDQGEIEFNGSKVVFANPRDSAECGISIVYQEPIYFRELSVVENIYLGKEIYTKQKTLDWQAMTIGATQAVEMMGLPPSIIYQSMSELTLGTQQLVLIARNIHRNAKILILDEPTAILSRSETDTLFKKIDDLRNKGVGILYISHRLEEIFQISDRISVLRDGIKVSEYLTVDADEEKLVTSMTGRKLSFEINKDPLSQVNETLLSVRNLSRAGSYNNISFDLHPGEILGFYGLVGAGRSEVMKAIYGEMRHDEGQILYRNEKFSPKNSREALDLGIVYVPEDRREQGLFLIRSIMDNISAGVLSRVSSKVGIINSKAELEMAQKQVSSLEIKSSSIFAHVNSLSGGNQQKVVLGRGLSHEPKLLILDEPSHGIDVATKSEIHKLISSLAKENLVVCQTSIRG